MNKNENQICSISISHIDIMEKRIKPTLNKLKHHSGSVDRPLHIIVEGFDKDSRELYEIKEVRLFFKSLSKRFDNILSPLISMDSIYIFFKCIIPPKESTSFESFGYQMASSVIKMINRSEYGKDFASHITISVFSKFEPNVGIALYPITHLFEEDALIQSFLEGGMEVSINLAKIDKIYIKVKNWNFDGNILICFYAGKERNFESVEAIIPRSSLDDLDGALRKLISIHLSKFNIKSI